MAPAAIPAMPGSASASAATIPGSVPDHAAGRVHGTVRERLAAKRATDDLRVVVAKRRKRRLHRGGLGTIALSTRQAGHDHVEQLGIDKC